MNLSHPFKKFRSVVIASLILMTSMAGFSQAVVQTTVNWTTGWCNICGPTTGNYACAQGSGSGNWNNGIRTFNVVIPPGNIITGVCVQVNKVDCGLTNLCVNINGQNIQCQNVTPGSNCNCGACWPQNYCNSFPCPTGLPGFVYNGTNTLQLVNTGNLCVNNAVITLTYQVCCPVPTIVASASPSQICIGQSSSLTANGAGVGGTYTWQPGNIIGPNAVVSPTATTIYTVSGTTSLACTGIQTVQVVVNPLPNITGVANPSAVCLQGQTTTTINFGGGVSYTMQPGNVVGLNAIVSPVVPTVYTITGTSAAGCVKSGTILIGINPSATASASSPSVCQGSNLILSASGGTAYSWTGPNGYTATGQSPSIPNAVPNQSGNYTVVVTSSLGCTASTITNAYVVPSPVVTINHNAQPDGICFGGTLNLNANAPAGASFAWMGPNGFVSSIQSPSLVVNMLSDGIYTVYINVNTCTNVATSPVTVHPLPTPVLLNNSPVCLFQPITFTASGALNYTLSGPNGYISNNPNAIIPIANNVTAGTYTLGATDIYGCFNVTSANVNINPLPVLSPVGSTVCANTTISLSVSGAQSYTWNGPAGFTSNAPSNNIQNADPSMSGNYTVFAVDANGCTTASLANVMVNLLPTPTAAVTSPVCVGNEAKFTSGDPVGAATAYFWNGPNGFFTQSQNTSITNVESPMAGLYTLTASDANGCKGRYFVNLIINPLPVGVVAASNGKGCIPLCSSFSVQSASTLNNISWEIGSLGNIGTGPQISNCFSNAGTYAVNASFTDQFGCSNKSVNFEVNAYPIPVADFNIAPVKPTEGEEVELSDASHDAPVKEWTWYFTEQTNTVSVERNPHVNYQNAGSYPIALIVRSDKGCADTIVKTIVVGEEFSIYVPNAFTPNGDGVNDTFQPKGLGISRYELNIFNRWGERIFTTHDFTQGWDGTGPKGKDVVAEGVYVWQIHVTNISGKSLEYKGTVSVIK